MDDYLREAAFTFLNRFVALKMLEARGLVQQCVSKGDQSSGFKEFTGLAPGLGSLPDKGYQLYLECLFDELGTEVKVLFDRRDPASLLWPRRQALDRPPRHPQPSRARRGSGARTRPSAGSTSTSTAPEERRAMRDASAAPRNSRELAVRNQFFTPRYVVEFLTDNTLGRIWYEMRQGDTALKEQCGYLVWRPTEIFLQQGESAPDFVESPEGLCQEELLKQAVYVPFRAKKDPRDLKILDPACGSGHFLLYCFEMLITIYPEAWCDAASPASEITGRKLADDYPSLEVLKAAIPGLILQHNLHGIDIDPRCAQIAALALWMRAQRASNDFGIGRQDRGEVERTNIVIAEPMPGEKKLLDEFIATELSGSPEDHLVGQLVRHVFESMQLAGEAGSLLKIEEEVAKVTTRAKEQWKAPPRFVQSSLFGEPEPPFQETFRFAVAGISDAEFWNELEARIYQSLESYSESIESSNYQRRLFAQDATRGFAFIDLCRKRYDIVTMNPPFGERPASCEEYFQANFSHTIGDFLSMFFERALQFVNHHGKVGAITNRTWLSLPTFENLRTRVLGRLGCVEVAADLGSFVLDAQVETVAGILGRDYPDWRIAFWVRLLKTKAKAETLSRAIENLAEGDVTQPRSLRRSGSSCLCRQRSTATGCRMGSSHCIAPKTRSIVVPQM